MERRRRSSWKTRKSTRLSLSFIKSLRQPSSRSHNAKAPSSNRSRSRLISSSCQPTKLSRTIPKNLSMLESRRSLSWTLSLKNRNHDNLKDPLRKSLKLRARSKSLKLRKSLKLSKLWPKKIPRSNAGSSQVPPTLTSLICWTTTWLM